MKARQLVLMTAVALLMTACAGGAKQQEQRETRQLAYEERREMIQDIRSWELSARVALSDGRQAGSGDLRWRHDNGTDVLDFRAGLGQGAWRLTVPGSGPAVLETGNGERFENDNLGELVAGQVGWEVPVAALADWVLGLTAEGPDATMLLDEAGRIEIFRQNGWTVTYRRYDGESPSLPWRLSAEKDDYELRLAVRDWQVDGQQVTARP